MQPPHDYLLLPFLPHRQRHNGIATNSTRAFSESILYVTLSLCAIVVCMKLFSRIDPAEVVDLRKAQFTDTRTMPLRSGPCPETIGRC